MARASHSLFFYISRAFCIIKNSCMPRPFACGFGASICILAVLLMSRRLSGIPFYLLFYRTVLFILIGVLDNFSRVLSCSLLKYIWFLKRFVFNLGSSFVTFFSSFSTSLVCFFKLIPLNCYTVKPVILTVLFLCEIGLENLLAVIDQLLNMSADYRRLSKGTCCVHFSSGAWFWSGEAELNSRLSLSTGFNTSVVSCWPCSSVMAAVMSSSTWDDLRDRFFSRWIWANLSSYNLTESINLMACLVFSWRVMPLSSLIDVAMSLYLLIACKADVFLFAILSSISLFTTSITLLYRRCFF